MDTDTREKWDRLMEVRGVVLKALEEARQAKVIGTSLEANVKLAGYSEFAGELPGIFIVSQVTLVPGDELKATVERADGTKCERCWNFSTHVGESSDFPTVCERCVAALEEIERTTGLPPVTPKP